MSYNASYDLAEPSVPSKAEYVPEFTIPSGPFTSVTPFQDISAQFPLVDVDSTVLHSLPKWTPGACSMVLGSHDVSAMRELLGRPKGVLGAGRACLVREGRAWCGKGRVMPVDPRMRRGSTVCGRFDARESLDGIGAQRNPVNSDLCLA